MSRLGAPRKCIGLATAEDLEVEVCRAPAGKRRRKRKRSVVVADDTFVFVVVDAWTVTVAFDVGFRSHYFCSYHRHYQCHVVDNSEVVAVG